MSALFRFLVLICPMGILTTIFVLVVSGYRLNFTPSMPIGLYKKSTRESVARGDFVSVCLPADFERHGIKRHYLRKGSCPGGSEAVLKEAIGVPGDIVRLTESKTIINKYEYFSPIQKEDRAGRRILRTTHLGANILGGKQLWLYGSHDPIRSWDSRYYGAISSSLVRGIYKPVLVVK